MNRVGVVVVGIVVVVFVLALWAFTRSSSQVNETEGSQDRQEEGAVADRRTSEAQDKSYERKVDREASETAQALGSVLSTLGTIVWVGAGAIGFFLCIGIVEEVLGFFGVVLGFMFFPVLLGAAPWYALVAWGNPIPLIVCYGGGIVGVVLYGAAESLSSV